VGLNSNRDGMDVAITIGYHEQGNLVLVLWYGKSVGLNSNADGTDVAIIRMYSYFGILQSQKRSQ